MKLAQAIVFVADVPRMQAFYVGTLGLTVMSAEPGWVRLDAGGVVLGLHAIRGLPAVAEPAPVRDQACTKLCFHADDVAATRERLIAAGVRMHEVHVYGALTFCDGVDPEGNVFQITTR